MELRGNKYIKSYLLAVLALPLLLLTACQRDELDDSSSQNGEYKSILEVQTEIADAKLGTETGTRSVVSGTTLAESGRTYGIVVCKHEDSPTNYEIYDDKNLYGNIQAWYDNYNSKGTKWWYSYEKTPSAYYQPLFLVTDDPSKHLDIYAYSPWKSGITLQGGFDYDLSSVNQDNIVDPMYATYEGCSDLAITKDGPLTPKVTFHHALARIVFHLKLANAQNTGLDGDHALRLYQIQLLHKSGATTPLYTKGRMNLLTGTVTSLQTFSQTDQTVIYGSYDNAGSILPWNIYQSDEYRTFNMLVHPTTYQNDGDFSFMFWFNGTGNSQTLINTYDIKRSDLDHQTKDASYNEIYGFQPGYCYHFYFIIDNYIHLQNVKINLDWTNTDEEEIKI